MYLTKKSLLKIWCSCAVCVGVGVFFLLLWRWDTVSCGGENGIPPGIGIAWLVIAVLGYPIGRYSQGTAKLLNAGNKLLMTGCMPASFLRFYESFRSCSENVVSKPRLSVLQQVASAYSVLGDEASERVIIEQMISVAPKKKKSMANLLKVSLLYGVGETEAAEALFRQVQAGKMTMTDKMLADIILKTDRAIAIGDFPTAEAYFRQQITGKSLPKPTPLMLLIAHFELAEICLKTDRPLDAKVHYYYCVENGGETIFRAKAIEQMKSL